MVTIDAPDVALSADTWGRGPHAVFVHGTFANRHVFDGLRESLADRLTTTAFDLRGHGDSDAPRNADYSLDGYTRDLAAVLDGIDDPVTLVGWSLGAKTVLRYLDTHNAPNVERIVLTSSGLFHEVGGEGPRPVPYLDFGAYRRRVCTEWPELAADFVDLLAGDTLADPTRRWLWRHCVDTPVHVARAHIDARLAAEVDFRRALEDVTVAVDVFHGANDAAATVTEAQAVAELVDGSCTIFEESAHFPFLTEPDQFEAALLRRFED